jgi:hypothetical protein
LHQKRLGFMMIYLWRNGIQLWRIGIKWYNYHQMLEISSIWHPGIKNIGTSLVAWLPGGIARFELRWRATFEKSKTLSSSIEGSRCDSLDLEIHRWNGGKTWKNARIGSTCLDSSPFCGKIS